MNTQEISKYVFDKQIPLWFKWEDGNIYEFDITSGDGYITNSFGFHDYGWQFPKWDTCSFDSSISFYSDDEDSGFTVFSSRKSTMEECIGEFLFWWEINKSRCKSISYYEGLQKVTYVDPF